MSQGNDGDSSPCNPLVFCEELRGHLTEKSKKLVQSVRAYKLSENANSTGGIKLFIRGASIVDGVETYGGEKKYLWYPKIFSREHACQLVERYLSSEKSVFPPKAPEQCRRSGRSRGKRINHDYCYYNNNDEEEEEDDDEGVQSGVKKILPVVEEEDTYKVHSSFSLALTLSRTKIALRMLHNNNVITESEFTRAAHRWVMSSRCAMPYCLAPHSKDVGDVTFREAWDATDPKAEIPFWCKFFAAKSSLCRCVHDAKQRDATNLTLLHHKSGLFAESQRLLIIATMLVEKLGVRVSSYVNHQRKMLRTDIGFLQIENNKLRLKSSRFGAFIRGTKRCRTRQKKLLRMEVLASVLVGFKCDGMMKRGQPLFIPLHNKEHTLSESISDIKVRYHESEKCVGTTFESYDSLRVNAEIGLAKYAANYSKEMKSLSESEYIGSCQVLANGEHDAALYVIDGVQTLIYNVGTLMLRVPLKQFTRLNTTLELFHRDSGYRILYKNFIPAVVEVPKKRRRKRKRSLCKRLSNYLPW